MPSDAESWGLIRYKEAQDPYNWMYPKPSTFIVDRETTLREFISSLGSHTRYAYDRRVIGVLVNDKRLWDSAKLKPGDKVTIFPIIVGG